MSVAVFPDGRRVVSGAEDRTLKVWDVATGKCVATLESGYVRRAASAVLL
jgi:WD40 repeat protein